MNKDKNVLIEEMKKCKNVVNNAKLPLWDELPKLELYMDQVVVLLNEYLGYIYEINTDEKNVTASMINNYVKMKIIPAPNKKKYSRIHLSRLIMICSLKKSLNISTVHKLLPQSESEEENKLIYNSFVNSRREAVENNLRLIERELDWVLNENEVTGLGDMITRMAVAADLQKMFTEKFSDIVFKNEEAEIKKDEKADKKSEKKQEKNK